MSPNDASLAASLACGCCCLCGRTRLAARRSGLVCSRNNCAARTTTACEIRRDRETEHRDEGSYRRESQAEYSQFQHIVARAVAASAPSRPLVYPILRFPFMTSQRVELLRMATAITLCPSPRM